MAQGEVSTQMVIKENCGLNVSSLQDLLQLSCLGREVENQAGGLDNSFVFVSGTDAVGYKDDDGSAEELLHQESGEVEALNDEEPGDSCNSCNGDAVPSLVSESLAVTELSEALDPDAKHGDGNIEDVETGDLKKLETLSLEESTGSQEKIAKVFEHELRDRESYDEVSENSEEGEKMEQNLNEPEASPGSAVDQESNVENLELACELVGSAEPGVPASTLLHMDSDSCPNNDKEPSSEKLLSPGSAADQESNVENLEFVGTAEPEVPASSFLHMDSDSCLNNDEEPSSEEKVMSPTTPNPPETKHIDDIAVSMSMETTANLVVEEEKEGSSVYHCNGDAESSEPVEHVNGDGVPCESMEVKIRTDSPVSINAPQTEAPNSYLRAVLDGPKPEIRKIGALGINDSGSESDLKQSLNADIAASNPLSSCSVTESLPTKDDYHEDESASILPDTPEVLIQNISSCEGKIDMELEANSCNSKVHQANEETQNHHADYASEDSNKNEMNREAKTETKTKPFNFLVRVPRCDDESLREQIKLAKIQVDEKTKLRDEIQAHIKQKRANIQNRGVDYEYAKREASKARKLVRLKRNEIDSLDHLCKKARNAGSIEDIDIQIRSMENKIQHETLPLKEEKLLIQDIKKLNQLRGQISSSLGNQVEIKRAVEQIKEVEERLQILRNELDVLKEGFLKAEEDAVEAGNKFENEGKEFQELQSRFRDADDVRQAAYVHWQSLKRDLSEKNKLFYKYKDDTAVAGNHAFDGNTEGVHRLCLDQVGNFMEMWNKNPEFREEYVRLNARSSIRRLGTLDGRTLGPDEKKQTVTIPSVDANLSNPLNTELRLENSVPEKNPYQETASAKAISSEKPKTEEPEKQHQKTAASERVNEEQQHTESMDEKGPEVSREEADSLREAEEKRKEEAEANLKAQRRSEEIAKANEARQRKKKQQERMQMRAELNAQKEAEEKEKEREKRQRKKERRQERNKAHDTSSNNTPETAPRSEPETVADKEIKDSSSSITRMPQKPRLLSKHSKPKSLPPLPLRNKNKRKLQQWMWLCAISLFILVLFCLGNKGSECLPSLSQLLLQVKLSLI